MTRVNDGWCQGDDDASGFYVKTADPTIAAAVLAADENDEEGRSQFVWVRLPNGDLILGVFPQGGTYHLATEADPNRP